MISATARDARGLSAASSAAHAHSAVVRTKAAVAFVRGAAKNRHACFHHAGQRLQCDALYASGSGKQQGGRREGASPHSTTDTHPR
jgi:hypothetical protein